MMNKGKKPVRRGMVASKPVKMNDRESTITTRVGKERKEDQGTKKTNSKENTTGTLRNEEETDKDEIQEETNKEVNTTDEIEVETNKEVKTKDEIEGETNKEMKTKDEIEVETNKEVKTKDEMGGETNKEMKTKDEIEGESKDKVKKLSKINKRKKIALGVVNVMIPEGIEKPESSDTKKIALGGGDALAAEDPTKKKSLNMERKEKIVVIDSNELVGNDLEKSKSSNTFSTRKRMALTISDAMTNQDGNEQKSSIKKRKKRKMDVKSPNEVVAKDIAKLKESKKEKMEKETVGMIFMCNSETKNDCYRYKVLGLPRSKKDIVLQIHKGMMLFLFDFDLKLLYGIYKAAGPGAFDIEPRAFKSAFPAQVRFIVAEDCLPVAEEKFKTVIRDNYYSKNKFNCQLTSEQVKSLCKLFRDASKLPKSKWSGRSPRAQTHAFVNRERMRQHRQEREGPRQHRHERERPRQHSREHERPRMHSQHERLRRHSREHERLPAFDGGRLYGERPVVYEREALATRLVHSPLPAPLPQSSYVFERALELDTYRRNPLGDLPPRLPQSSYVYERALELDTYRRNPLGDHRYRQLSDLELRHQDRIENRDPYIFYREHPLYDDSLQAVHKQPEDRLARPRVEYRHPEGTRLEYHAVPSLYRLPGGIQPEYPPLPSLHRVPGDSQPEYPPLPPLYRY